MNRDQAMHDPEILDDLRRREASERDRSRTCEVAHAMGDPAIVERWPCDGCGVMVGVTSATLDARETCNRKLAQRREALLPKRAQCDKCRRKGEEARAAARRPHEQRELLNTNERPSGMRAVGKGRP